MEQTEDGPEELNVYVFKACTRKEREIATGNAQLKEELIQFCIENWGNDFIQEIKKEMTEQAELQARI